MSVFRELCIWGRNDVQKGLEKTHKRKCIFFPCREASQMDQCWFSRLPFLSFLKTSDVRVLLDAGKYAFLQIAVVEIEEKPEILCLIISDMPLLLSFVVAVHQALVAIIMGWGRMFKKFVTPSYCHCHGRHYGQTRCDDKSVFLSTADSEKYSGSKVKKVRIHHTSEHILWWWICYYFVLLIIQIKKKTLRMKELKSSVGLGGKPGDGGEEVNKDFKDAIIGSLTSLSYVSTSIVWPN